MPQDTNEMEYFEEQDNNEEPEKKDESNQFDFGLGSFDIDMSLAPSF